MYNTDKPIKDINEDLLDRGNFANHLAKAILRFDSKDNFVIGLYGKWGTGKTSIINMMIHEIKKETLCWSYEEKPIVFKFEPWNFSDNENLITQFFRILRKQIDLKENSKMKQHIGKFLEEYSETIGMAVDIPKIGLFAKILQKTMSLIGKNINEKYSNAGIDDAKDKLTTALENQKQKIIVIIDDIDRLSNNQIRMIFQLVKQVGGFPNITYILSMDKEVVVRALEDMQKCDGSEYLEKIVQIPFKVPELDKEKVSQIFLDRLEQIIQSNGNHEIDMEYWGCVFKGCIEPYIKTIRDVNRVTNAFHVKYTLLSEEVDFSDLVAITTLEIMQPFIFSWILENKSLITGGSYIYNGGSYAERKDVKTTYVELFEKENVDGELAVRAIATLFPKFGKKVEHNYELIRESSLRGKMRIASENKFDLYFNLNIESVEISQTIINESIYRLNENELQQLLLDLEERGKSLTYLEEIHGKINDIPYERIAMFLNVLYKNKKKLRGEKIGFLMFVTTENLADQCIQDLMGRLETTKERFDIYNSLLEKADILLIEGMCADINRIELGYARLAGKETNEKLQILSLDELMIIERKYAECMNKLALEDTIFEAESLLFVEYLWRNFAKEDCNMYFVKKIQNDINKLKLVCKLGTSWIGTEGKGWSFDKKNYEEYVSEDDVYDLIENYDKTRLQKNFTSEEILKLAFFVLNRGMGELDHVSEKEAKELVGKWQKAAKY